MAAPAHAEKPARQRASDLRQMATRIQEDIGQRVPHLARSAQDMQVVAVREHGSAPPEDPVHGSCEPCADGLHAGSEIARAHGFDECVDVIVLNGIVHQAEAPAVARRSEAARSSRTSRTVRNEGKPRRTFNVTWHGNRAASGARTRCEWRGLGPRLRPAPARLPPQRDESRRSRSSCRARRAIACTLTCRCDRDGHTRHLNCAMFSWHAGEETLGRHEQRISQLPERCRRGRSSSGSQSFGHEPTDVHRLHGGSSQRDGGASRFHRAPIRWALRRVGHVRQRRRFLGARAA